MLTISLPDELIDAAAEATEWFDEDELESCAAELAKFGADEEL